MSFDPTVRKSLMDSIKRQQEKGYIRKVDVEGGDLPTTVMFPSEVPIRGNVHISLGRAISRKIIDKKFSKD